MKKQNVSEIIFETFRELRKYTETKMFSWLDVQEHLKEANIELQPDDILEIGFDPGFYEEDHSSDACYYIKVTRTREQTEEEFEKYRKDIEEIKLKSKQNRFESYLKLKQEFESN